MEHSGLVGQIEADFHGWGAFHIDNADVCLMMQTAEDVDPALLAVTWMNETTFRFYSEPNDNHSDDFDKWDVGPMQVNRGVVKLNIANKFLNAKGIDLLRALDTSHDQFNGDPLENIRLACRLLLRIGRGTITGPSQTVLYPSVADHWADVPEVERNERRAVAYTGPEARPARYQSWIKYAPLFTEFFKLYTQ